MFSLSEQHTASSVSSISCSSSSSSSSSSSGSSSSSSSIVAAAAAVQFVKCNFFFCYRMPMPMPPLPAHSSHHCMLSTQSVSPIFSVCRYDRHFQTAPPKCRQTHTHVAIQVMAQNAQQCLRERIFFLLDVLLISVDFPMEASLTTWYSAAGLPCL